MERSKKFRGAWKYQPGDQRYFKVKFWPVAIVSLLVFASPKLETAAQKLDVAYVPTSHSIVEKMLDVANVGPGDYVIDLGSGDGRMVIAAAKRGAFGHGVDLDPERVVEGKKNARKAGVADRVTFIQEDIYETDFSRASVILMYLFPTINIKLRSALLKKLEPGTRVVSHDFGMDYWLPDEYLILDDGHEIYFWIIPADMEGMWSWQAGGKKFRMDVSQEFQEIEPAVRSENDSFSVDNLTLSGKRVSFVAYDRPGKTNYVYSGRVEGDYIIGTAQVHSTDTTIVEKWTARRH